MVSRALGVGPVLDIPLEPEDPEEQEEEPAPQPHSTEPPPSLPAPSEPDDDDQEERPPSSVVFAAGSTARSIAQAGPISWPPAASSVAARPETPS